MIKTIFFALHVMYSKRVLLKATTKKSPAVASTSSSLFKRKHIFFRKVWIFLTYIRELFDPRSRSRFIFYIPNFFFAKWCSRGQRLMPTMRERIFDFAGYVLCVYFCLCAHVSIILLKYIWKDISGDLDEGQFSLLIWCFLYML